MFFSNQLGFILEISLFLFMHMLAQTDITMPRKNGNADIILDGNILIRSFCKQHFFFPQWCCSIISWSVWLWQAFHVILKLGSGPYSWHVWFIINAHHEVRKYVRASGRKPKPNSIKYFHLNLKHFWHKRSTILQVMLLILL
jgi:hypothetical protein